MTPPNLALDHLVVAGPELTELAALLQRATGVDAEAGGRHLGHGTHNRLVGLGPGCYLELLAPDPAGEPGPFLELTGIPARPAAHTLCARTALGAEGLARRAEALGLQARRLPMTRRLADGGELAWELIFLRGHGYGALMPFFIDWCGAVHPSLRLKPALELRAIACEHPDAEGLGALLLELTRDDAGEQVAEGPRLELRRADAASLRLTLAGPAGLWRL